MKIPNPARNTLEEGDIIINSGTEVEIKPPYEEGEPVRHSVQRKTSSMLKPRKNKEKYYLRMCNLLCNAFCKLINIPHVAIGTLLSVVCGYACIKNSYDHYNAWCISTFYVTLRPARALKIMLYNNTDHYKWA